MKPSSIKKILEMAERARANGDMFTPCFVSPPGIGKSEIVEASLESMGYKVIDLRTAFLEAPDVLGFPHVDQDAEGRQRTIRATPSFWPSETDGKVAIFIDEFNRGQTSVNNCFMQLLTKRQVGDNYKLPASTLIVAAINPEDGDYDVTAMDPALKDRLEFFKIEYSKNDFLAFIKSANWHPTLISWVESGTYKYVEPQDVGNSAGSKYLSPRTLSKLNAALRAGVETELEIEIYKAVLGDNMGKDFYDYKNDNRPVTFDELVANKKARKEGLERLVRYSDPKNYLSGQISATVRSLLENHANPKCDDSLITDVLQAVPADVGTALIEELRFRRNDPTIFNRLIVQNASLSAKIKETLKKVTE